ncbi:hypothetical protein N3C_2329 [Clostridium sp. N3C]|uniref:hypothetical protein n=1 Tax=Clostridium sp. N3C TaxID=1776758 RepID=UPI00092DF2A2|nr:hypothetical protein [Clostridium sp. N3C]SCN25463.1 hypothetical protein N3C_2329 [Clostridium sp. N3C]
MSRYPDKIENNNYVNIKENGDTNYYLHIINNTKKQIKNVYVSTYLNYKQIKCIEDDNISIKEGFTIQPLSHKVIKISLNVKDVPKGRQKLLISISSYNIEDIRNSCNLQTNLLFDIINYSHETIDNEVIYYKDFVTMDLDIRNGIYINKSIVGNRLNESAIIKGHVGEKKVLPVIIAGNDSDSDYCIFFSINNNQINVNNDMSRLFLKVNKETSIMGYLEFNLPNRPGTYSLDGTLVTNPLSKLDQKTTASKSNVVTLLVEE